MRSANEGEERDATKKLINLVVLDDIDDLVEGDPRATPQQTHC